MIYMTTHNELLVEATQNYAMAHHYLSKLKVTLDQLSAVQSGIAQSARPPVRCVREWQDWLARNGPAIKADVHEGTGIKFTERGTPYTVEWTPSLSGEPDDRFAPTTLMKIGTKAVGRGAPAKVFFLWSQRWDVHPLFGVGPIKPGTDLGQQYLDRVTAPIVLTEEDETTIADLLARPVAVVGGVAGEAMEAVGLAVHQRYANLEAWDEAWTPAFDSYEEFDIGPTPEIKQMMFDTLPEGADGNAALAIARRAAVERARQRSDALWPAEPFGATDPPDGDGEPQEATEPVSEQSETLLGVVMPPACVCPVGSGEGAWNEMHAPDCPKAGSETT